jgi:nitrous oxidase accessory protein
MLNLSRFANFVAASNIIYYVEPGDNIQMAINRANPGDILLIKRGVYKEYPIFVNKSLTIIGESREETIIDGEELADLIINIMADNVKISNLTIQNTGGGAYPPVQKGIQITAVKNVEISDCTIKNCATNLRLGGSSFSRILRNRITHALTNGYGVHLDENSEYNEITSNYISFNDVGIQVERTATNNTIYHNNFMNNSLDVGGPASGANNRWHNGYPSGGNYWDKNSGEDLKSGVQQIEDGSDGLCDKSYNSFI